MEQERVDVTQGKRGLRPFPAIDPEPAHRYTWRTARRAGVVCLAACVVAGGTVAGVRLSGASSPGRAGRPSAAAPAAKFTDDDGLIVFEQQPSGLLGTASPDGGHAALDKSLGPLQGNDLPVASPDGRYLANQEGQLIALGTRGPSSVTQLAPPSPLAGDQPGGGMEWMTPTFAEGSRYLAVTECDPIGKPGLAGNEAWASWLVPTSAGKPQSLGMVTASSGAPETAGVVAALAADPAAEAQHVTCDGQADADQALALLSPGKPPRVIVTAAAVVRAAGWPPDTQVELSAVPSPDGGTLAVSIEQDRLVYAEPISRVEALRSAQFLVSRTGKVLGALPGAGLVAQFAWSPGSDRLATCYAAPGKPSTVSVVNVGGTSRVIRLPGHSDVACEQLLWSPDGSQLIYSAFATEHGLTQADRLQHGWTVIDLHSGKVHDVTAPGQPAAWLPRPSGTAS